MVYGYVSNAENTKSECSLEVQKRKLLDARATFIVQETSTGVKEKRPEFEKLIERLNPGDTLVVCKMNVLGCDFEQVLEVVEMLFNKGVIINILTMGSTDDISSGRIMKMIFQEFIELKKETAVPQISTEKQQHGLRKGRPHKFDEELLEQAAKLLETHTFKEVTGFTGISKSTLIRFMKNKNFYHSLPFLKNSSTIIIETNQ